MPAKCFALSLLLAGLSMAATELPPPTHAEVPYGDHPRQVLDAWLVAGEGPHPFVLFIHGGGWGALDKVNVKNLLNVPRLLEAGVAVISINYRFTWEAQRAGVEPALQWPLYDAGRALQFVRSKAAEWRLDKTRVGACGGSAGACSALWLAFHDDLADRNSAEPIARESTRLTCAAVVGAQTSLDPLQMRQWMPNVTYGGHAFGFRTDGKDRAAEFQRFYDARDLILPWIRAFSPYELATADDPPVYLEYSQQARAVMGEAQEDPTHSAVFGLGLLQKLTALGVEAVLTYPAERDGRWANCTAYLIDRLVPAVAAPAQEETKGGGEQVGWRP